MLGETKIYTLTYLNKPPRRMLLLQIVMWKHFPEGERVRPKHTLLFYSRSCFCFQKLGKIEQNICVRSLHWSKVIFCVIFELKK